MQYSLEKEQLSAAIGKFLLVLIVVGLLVSSMVYLNKRWSRIRDIRRQADAEAIIKALNYYNIQYNEFPENPDDDGSGWDQSNDAGKRSFLEKLVSVGLFSTPPFDPKNDNSYYYRYQKFPTGSFSCRRPFAVFQIMQFESQGIESGGGICGEKDFVKLAPNGFTWLEFD